MDKFETTFLRKDSKTARQEFRLFLVRDGIVELEDVPFCAFEFRFLELDGRARMQVAQAGQQIGQVIAPEQFRAHRLDVILHAIEDGAKLVFRIMQKTDEQFHRAIARAAAQAGHGGVEEIGALDDAFDGVGVGQLQIVVRMHAHFLAGRFAVRQDTS